MDRFGERTKAIIEILFFLTILISVFVAVDIIIEQAYAHWVKKGVMIILGVLVILLKKKPREYGIVPSNPKLSIKWSCIIMLIFIVPAGILAIPNSVVSYSRLLVDFIWFMIFTGVAEEVVFRGYIQSRLNECFTREYQGFVGFRVRWHEGTLITGALIFGPMHLLNAIDFRTGEINVDFSLVFVVIMASLFGVFFGVIREVSGDIIICAVFHGILNFTTMSLLMRAMGTSYWVPLAISFSVFFGFLFEKFIGDFTREAT